MGILSWIILGLLAGALAKAMMPGPDGGGLLITMVLGIVGAMVGGAVGGMLFGTGLAGFSLQSLILAVLGSLLVLWLYRMSRRGKRTTTGTPGV